MERNYGEYMDKLEQEILHVADMLLAHNKSKRIGREALWNEMVRRGLGAPVDMSRALVSILQRGTALQRAASPELDVIERVMA